MQKPNPEPPDAETAPVLYGSAYASALNAKKNVVYEGGGGLEPPTGHCSAAQSLTQRFAAALSPAG